MTPKVIAETAELLVLDKPAGLIVHSDGRTEEPSVAEWLAQNYPELRNVGDSWVSPQGVAYPLNGIVHRLDRTTSGVLLVAKTSEAYAELKQAFKERRVEKTYLAYVHGHMEEQSGSIVAEIMRSSDVPRKWYARPTTKDDIRAAITEWKLLKTHENCSLLEARPKTGRTHQIRVHFSGIGHPLVGDERYGGAPALGIVRPALHTSRISFEFRGERPSFEAPLPPDFPQAAQKSHIIGFGERIL